MPDTERAKRALELFGMSGDEISPIRENENLIFSVTQGCGRYALRIHQCAPGFDPMPFTAAPAKQQREAEGELLCCLDARGIRVQKPVRGPDGSFVQTEAESGALVTLLSWLPGETYNALYPEGDVPEDAAFAAGLAAGALDRTTNALVARFTPVRPRYGVNVLPITAERLRAAADAGDIGGEQLIDMLSALDAMAPRMRAAAAEHGVAVCHADISAGNLIYSEKKASLIDFSLSGISSPYMDLASLLSNFIRPDVRAVMAAGFEEGFGKKLQLRHAEPFFALQILFFISMLHGNATEWDWFPIACERWCRDVFRPFAAGKPCLDIANGQTR